MRVNLPGRGYEIRIGTGLLAEAGSFLNETGDLRRAIVVTDSQVAKFHAQPFANSLSASGVKVDTVVVESGEPTKCVAEAEQLWNKFLKLGADRKTLVVALGGGVVGDLAGFIAATFGADCSTPRCRLRFWRR